jgi:hypothetical protein
VKLHISAKGNFFSLENCIITSLFFHIDIFSISIVYFDLEEFESAKTTFETGLKLAQQSSKDTSQYERYIRKCDLELSKIYFYIVDIF